jgi:hypothetical protein
MSSPTASGLGLAYHALLYDSRKVTANIDPRVDGR